MPELPYHQSEGLPSDTSRQPLASPGIVGGEGILQGMQKVQQSLMHLFQVQQYQMQAEQVMVAGEMRNQFLQNLANKATELQRAQEDAVQNGQPMRDPRTVSDDFNAHTKELFNTFMDHPSIQDKPFVKKWLATHLAVDANSAMEQHMKKQNKAWEDWSYANTLMTLSEAKKSVLTGMLPMNEFAGLLAGYQAVGILKPDEVKKYLDDTNYAKDYTEAVNVVQQDPAGYLKMRGKGLWPEGVPYWKLDPPALDRLTTQASEALSRQNAETERIQKERDDREKELHATTYNLWMQKRIATDDAGNRLYSTKSIVQGLNTEEARITLGPHYPTVLHNYTMLADQEKNPRPTDFQKYVDLLKKVHAGGFADESTLITEAAAAPVDANDMTRLLAVFTSHKQQKDAVNEERFRHAMSAMEEDFKIPTNSVIDAAPFQAAFSRAKWQYIIKWDELRQRAVQTGDPNIMKAFDAIGYAKQLAEEGIRPLLPSQIQIVKTKLSHLPYKSEEALKAAREKEEITQEEYNNHLADFQRISLLEEIQKNRSQQYERKPFGESR